MRSVKKFSVRPRVIRRSFGRTQYFSSYISEGKSAVSAPLSVPEEIRRPPYITQKNYQYSNPAGNSVSRPHSPDSIKCMKKAGRVAATALESAIKAVQNNQVRTTEDIDKIVHHSIVSQAAYPTPIGYMGFPKSVCTSVNDVVCHGIPDNRPLQKGDSINIDVTCYIEEGFHGDTSAMVIVPQSAPLSMPDDNFHPQVGSLVSKTRQALLHAINCCKPGEQFKTIGEVIHTFAKAHSLYISPHFGGHGIGRQLHQDPLILHDLSNQNPNVMKPGHTFTIQPILLLHPTTNFVMWRDGWTFVAPGVPSAQWEHTILITQEGCEVITKREVEEWDPAVPKAKTVIF